MEYTETKGNENTMIRLNVGCGGDLRREYINIDMHSKEEIGTRYASEIKEEIKIFNYDIFNLPYEDGSVDEVMTLGFLEHLSFEDEGRFFKEVKRVLKKGGLFHFTVPDFDSLCAQWLEAQDNFLDFYTTNAQEHWFGNNNRNIQNKYGYLLASFFGNQNGEGQFHRNAFTSKKICAIMKMLNFSHELSFFNFKNTEIKMIECKAYRL